MKNFYLLLTFTVIFWSFGANTQAQDCEAVGGIAVPPVSEVLTDGSDKANLEVTEYSTPPSGTPEHTFAVLSPELDENGDNFVIGVTDNGVFDFGPYPEGNYCFTGFAYSQAELDSFVTVVNPLLCILFGGADGALQQFCNEAEDRTQPVPVPAELALVFDVVGAAFDGITIPNIVLAIDSVTGLVPAAQPLCLGIATESHCVNVVDIIDGVDDLVLDRFDAVENYPNPFSGSTQISFNTLEPQNVAFNVFNIAGGLVYQEEVRSKQGVNTFTFEAGDYAPGIYLFTLNNGEKTITKRMIIK